MTTKFITVANRKGGVGKTTSSVYIATILSNLGHKVLLKDSDPQASATEWLEDLEGLPFDYEITNQRSMGKARGYDYVVIDTPPQNPDIINAAIEVADLVVIPTEASSIELSGAYALFDAMKPGALCRVLLTRVNTITNSFKHVKAALDAEKIPRFAMHISKNEAIKNSFRKIPEHPKELQEYEALIEEILNLIDE